MQGAGGGVGKAEMFVLWEADAVLANHHAPAALAEAESWATNEKTNRFGERVGDRLKQESPMNQPTREIERSFLKNCLKGGGGGALSRDAGPIGARAESSAGGARIRSPGERRRDLE